MKKNKTNYLPYIPIFGLGLYLIVFAFATSLYPGGSFNQPNANGYSFYHNLLCDAMDPITQSGIINKARFMAVISHLILSFTMICFFYILPRIYPKKNNNTKMISFFGVAAMFALVFMYTEYHDLMVTITGVLGTIAMISFFIELKQIKNKGLKNIAYLCFLLSIIVFLIFETKIGFYYLPILQKTAFAVDSCWVIWSCLVLINNNKTAVKLAHQIIAD